MKIPTSEVDWQKLLVTPKGVRSLFRDTDVVSMYVSTRDATQIVFEDVPFRNVPLKRFFVTAASVKDVKIFISLSIITGDSKGFKSKPFLVRWKSYFIDRKAGTIRFFYRPNCVFIIIPGNAVDRLAPLIPFNDSAFIRAKNNLLLSANGFWANPFGKSGTKHGFSGLPRSRDPIPNVEETVYDQEYSNGVLVDSSSRSITTRGHVIVSTTTPGFRSLKSRLLPINPWNFAIFATDDLPGSHRLSFVEIPVTHNFYFGSSAGTYFAPPGLSYDSNLKNKAISKLEDRAHSSISANIAQDIFQLHQLKRLVASTGKRMVLSLTKIDRRDYVGAIAALGLYSVKDIALVKKVTSALKTTAQNWLEIQYAWKPLLKDIDGLISLLNQTIAVNPPVLTVRSRSRLEKRYTLDQGPFFPSGNVIPMEVIEQHSVKIVVHYTIHDKLRTYVQQLGLTNGVNLAYEVLPFSFVADWFYPLGPYLESLTAWEGFTFKDGSITQTVKQNVSSYFEETHDFGSNVQVKSGGYRRFGMIGRREVLSNFPTKDLPRPKNPVSLTHALNAIALVVTGFKDPRHLR